MSEIRVTINKGDTFTEVKDDIFVISHTNSKSDKINTLIEGKASKSELEEILIASQIGIFSTLLKHPECSIDDVKKIQEKTNGVVLKELFRKNEGDLSGEDGAVKE